MRRPRRLSLIFNPHAGPADLDVANVAEFWRHRGWQVDLSPTQRAKHATELAKQAALDGVGLVLAGGGDGTLGEVANGLAGTDTIMAPLPMGTGNSFAKELGLPRPGLGRPHALLQASEQLASGRVQTMDMGCYNNSQHWLLWAGTGIDGYLVDEIEPRTKLFKRLGPPGYVMRGLAIMRRFPHLRAKIQVDDHCFEDEYLLITLTNCRLFAGGELLFSPDSVLDDGVFELILLRGHGFRQLFKHVWLIQQGRQFSSPDFMRVSGKRVQIETWPPMAVQTDGDPAGSTPFMCHVQPQALRVLVPPSAPEGLFSRPGEGL